MVQSVHRKDGTYASGIRFECINHQRQLLGGRDLIRLQIQIIRKFDINILMGGVLQLYGGTGYPFGENSSNEAYLMWPYGMHSIERLDTTGEKPEQLYGQAIMVQENFLYVLGGTSGHVFTCDIHR